MSDGALLYLREAELIIGPKEQAAPKEPSLAKRYGSRLVRDKVDPSRYSSGFRIAFNVDKTASSNANKSTISLYNISQESRNFLEEKALVLFLKAGYEGNISTIFFGDVIERRTARQGADVVTTLECGDQEQLIATANVQIGLQKGATNIQVFRAAAEALGLTIPARQLASIPQRQFAKGFSFTGTAKQLLDEQVDKVKFTWSIQDGEIQVLPLTMPTEAIAVLISQDTGLIDYPTKAVDGLKFKSLLNPELRIGRACKVQSKQFQGVFGAKAGAAASSALEDAGGLVIARKVQHVGDTDEGEWSTTVEGQAPGMTESVA